VVGLDLLAVAIATVAAAAIARVELRERSQGWNTAGDVS
jgi:hypothetical protein